MIVFWKDIFGNSEGGVWMSYLEKGGCILESLEIRTLLVNSAGVFVLRRFFFRVFVREDEFWS